MLKNYNYEIVQAEMAFKDLFGTEELIHARKEYFAYKSHIMPYKDYLKELTERKLQDE